MLVLKAEDVAILLAGPRSHAPVGTDGVPAPAQVRSGLAGDVPGQDAPLDALAQLGVGHDVLEEIVLLRRGEGERVSEPMGEKNSKTRLKISAGLTFLDQ